MSKQKSFHAETPRNNIVTVRFSDDEVEILDFVCQVLDQSRSQYIRRKALTGGIPRPEVRIAGKRSRRSTWEDRKQSESNCPEVKQRRRSNQSNDG